MVPAHGVGCGAQPLFRPTPEPRRLHPHPNPLPSRERGWVPSSRVAPGVRASTLICHCKEHPLIPSSSRDVAISMRLDIGGRTAVATATRLPRYARNDKVGTRKLFRAHGVGCGAQPLFRPTPEPRRLHPHPNPLPSRERGWVPSSRVAHGVRASTLICHCEEHPLIPSSSRDVAISMRLDIGRRTAVATATRLPRYARNDKVGTRKLFRAHGVGCGAQPLFRPTLRGNAGGFPLTPTVSHRGRGARTTEGFCVAGLVRGALYSLRLAALGYFAREGRLWTWA